MERDRRKDGEREREKSCKTEGEKERVEREKEKVLILIEARCLWCVGRGVRGSEEGRTEDRRVELDPLL